MNQQQTPTELTYLDHIRALRQTILRIILIILFFSSVVHYFRLEIVAFLQKPLGDDIADLQFLSPTDPLFFILKVDFTLGFLISLPLVGFLLWKFISPAVESKISIAPYMVILISTLLSLMAGTYAYVVLVPIILTYMSSLAMPGTILAFTANGYFNFLLSTTALLILVFQIPLVVVGLTYIKLLNPFVLSKNRPYIYTGLLVIAAVITPTTDAITLLLIALPAALVLEVGIFIARIIHTKLHKQSQVN